MQHIISNRRNKKIVLDYNEAHNAKALVFLQHGLSGFKEQPHILAMADTFVQNGFNVVNFDATNSFGESDGDLCDVTLTTHNQDLEDVIQWARNQPWYKEPFILSGHSLGGASILKFAMSFPQKVLALAPLSSVVPELWIMHKSPEEIRSWKKEGFITKTSSLRPERTGRISFKYAEDMLSHQVLNQASKIVIPILLVVGTRDDSTPPIHQQYLFELWGGPKTYEKIEESGHTFKTEKELLALKQILQNWINGLPL